MGNSRKRDENQPNIDTENHCKVLGRRFSNTCFALFIFTLMPFNDDQVGSLAAINKQKLIFPHGARQTKCLPNSNKYIALDQLSKKR